MLKCYKNYENYNCSGCKKDFDLCVKHEQMQYQFKY